MKMLRKHLITHLLVFGVLLPTSNAFLNRVQCYLRYQALDFDITNLDAFDTYFRDDSIMVLAQTGEYLGVESIREYTTFTNPGSPYISDIIVVSSSTRSGGYDESTGQCIFDVAIRRRFVLNTANTNPDIQDFDGFSMAKLYFDFEKRYITRVNLFFPSGVVKFVFQDILESDNTRSYVCNLLKTTCAPYVSEDTSTCASDLAALPAGESFAGTDLLYADGNASGCRALHATFADLSPAAHCAHVSLSTSDLDSNGKNKCSVSEQATVESLFDQDDLDFFNEFASSQGVDPNDGVFYPSPEIEEPWPIVAFFTGICTTIVNLCDLLFGGLF